MTDVVSAVFGELSALEALYDNALTTLYKLRLTLTLTLIEGSSKLDKIGTWSQSLWDPDRTACRPARSAAGEFSNI